MRAASAGPLQPGQVSAPTGLLSKLFLEELVTATGKIMLLNVSKEKGLFLHYQL